MVIFHSLLLCDSLPEGTSRVIWWWFVFFWDESGTGGRSFWAVDWFDCLFDAKLMEFRVSSKMFQTLHVWCLDVCWVWIKKNIKHQHTPTIGYGCFHIFFMIHQMDLRRAQHNTSVLQWKCRDGIEPRFNCVCVTYGEYWWIAGQCLSC